MKKRIDYIDIFRGIAILQMVIWQIFDFFYIKDIYNDTHYLLTFFNMPVHGIGVAWFAFISGACVYLSFSKRKKLRNKLVIKHFLKRYGGYIFLSLLFTTVVFDFNRFYTWFEAIQGIGLASLVAGLLLLFIRSKWLIGLISVAIIIIQPWLRVLAHSISNFPFEFQSFDIFVNTVSVLLNSTLRGFFSLSHLLPISLFGVLLGFFITRDKKPEKKSFILGLIFLAVSLILHFTSNSINYYDRSISYLFFIIGVSYLLFVIISYFHLKINILRIFGQATLIAYVVHYLFIYKPLKLIGLESTFRFSASWAYTIISVIFLYFLSRWWIQNKQRITRRLNNFINHLEQDRKFALFFSIIWFVISVASIMNLQIKGIYFYVWVAILFSAGSISMFFIINLILARKISSKVIIFSIVSLGILGGLTYILWDFDYSLAIINTRGQDVIGNITLTNSRGEVVAQTIDNELDISLQKGSYTLIIKSRGYEQNESSIVNTIGFKQNNDITQIVILKPKYINLSQFYFTEPTHTIKLSPVIHVIGSNILNEQVNQTLGKESALMYGEYSVELADENFELETNFQGDTFNEGYKIVLNPNDRFIVLTSKEVSHITNYINDYLSLNENLHSNDQGLPKQFYLYQRDQVISLGKMIFLFCEQQAYSKNRIENPLYFIPGDMKFKFSEPAKNTTECYFLALDGKIPQTIGNNSLQQEIYKELTKNPDNFYYPISELNSEKRNLEISFTFDIESGRYVPRNNKPAISPCESKDYSLGLEKNELLCDNPRLVAWMSPRGGKITYLDYPYPQVSGILGFREILSYSERYGIPTTNFIVKKDILAFEQLEPELIERTKKLIENGLFEVGAHTRYHTELGSVDISIAKHEVKESKKFLEAYFNTTVYGFRSPYLSKIGTKKTHEEVLMGIGYTYYSDAGEYSNEGIAHKPWNSYEFGHDYFSLKTASDVKKLMSKRSYIITLDHPWNIAYTHEDIIYETPETPDNLRTNVLTAISNGAISVMAKDIIIKN